jgi:hypothetical protein
VYAESGAEIQLTDAGVFPDPRNPTARSFMLVLHEGRGDPDAEQLVFGTSLRQFDVAFEEGIDAAGAGGSRSRGHRDEPMRTPDPYAMGRSDRSVHGIRSKLGSTRPRSVRRQNR